MTDTTTARWCAALAGYEAALIEDERLGCEPDERAWLESEVLYEAFEAMIDTPAATPEALAYKLQALLQRAHCPLVHDDAGEAATISELLTDRTYDGTWPLARVFQDALRLAGLRADLVAVEAPSAPAAATA